MAPAPAPVLTWATGLDTLDAEAFQKYMSKRQQTQKSEGISAALQHTLVAVPTSTPEDGFVHFGGALLLRNACTGGLLQMDSERKVPVENTGLVSAPREGTPLSTGTVRKPCPRSVFTISRVDDADAYPGDSCVHYGQLVRLGSTLLHEKPHYLFAVGGKDTSAREADPTQGNRQSETTAHTLVPASHRHRIPVPKPSTASRAATPEVPKATGEDAKPAQVCLFPRAAPGSCWRVLPPATKEVPLPLHRRQGPAEEIQGPLLLGAPFRLQSVVTGRHLSSDLTQCVTSYGNEWRVVGLPPQSKSKECETDESAEPPGPSDEWSFVDSRWAEEQEAHAQNQAASLNCADPWRSRFNVAELLQDPEFRAQQAHRRHSEPDIPSAWAALARVYPLIKEASIHSVRQLRRMCQSADVQDKGTLPFHTFEGVLSWVGLRLDEQEIKQVQELFGVGIGDQSVREESIAVDYRRFFGFMSPTMNAMRLQVVQEAYQKLREADPGGVVEVSRLRSAWDPQCNPQVRQRILSPSEAKLDFLKQWEVTAPDGSISWAEFVDYYQDVSAGVDDDAIFVEQVQRAWRL